VPDTSHVSQDYKADNQSHVNASKAWIGEDRWKGYICRERSGIVLEEQSDGYVDSLSFMVRVQNSLLL
jgi:hypothetical protein